MNIIQYRGFKNIFTGLVQDNNKYYILYGITGEIKIENKEEYNDCMHRDISIFTCLTKEDCNITIPFSSKNNKLFTFKEIKDINEYYDLISILEDLL